MWRTLHTPRFTGFGALFEMVPVCVVAQLFMHNKLFPTHQHLSPTAPTFTKPCKPSVFSSEIGVSLCCDLDKIRGVAMICQAAPRNVQVWGACRFSLYHRGPCILARDHCVRGHATGGACRKNAIVGPFVVVLLVFDRFQTTGHPETRVSRSSGGHPQGQVPAAAFRCTVQWHCMLRTD